MSSTASQPDPGRTIAFQGETGAYSHLACHNAKPDMFALPCATFEDAYQAVEDGTAELAMIPIENSVAGRVADNHHLLPDSGLKIVGEFFQPVHHCLLGVKGSKVSDLKDVYSHVQALGQCRNYLRSRGLRAHSHADTAGAARYVAEKGDITLGAVASALAAEVYGLELLEQDIEDEAHNTTRFVLMARKEQIPPRDVPTMMSFVFEVRNVPAALYKALGGFATNGVNMTKLESYQLKGTFRATQFYADIEGHPDDPSVQLALEELGFYSNRIIMLGTYPKSPFRDVLEENAADGG